MPGHSQCCSKLVAEAWYHHYSLWTTTGPGCPGSCWGPSLWRQSQDIRDNLSWAFPDDTVLNEWDPASAISAARRAAAVSRLSLSEAAPREAAGNTALVTNCIMSSSFPAGSHSSHRSCRPAVLASCNVTLPGSSDVTVGSNLCSCSTAITQPRAAPLWCFSRKAALTGKAGANPSKQGELSWCALLHRWGRKPVFLAHS